MSRHARPTGLALAACLLVSASAAELTSKQQSDLDAAVAEFQKAGHLAAALRLAPLAAIDATCDAIDAELRHRELLSLGEMLARARWEVVRDGQSAQLPRASAPELRRLLPTFRQLLHEEMDRVLGDPVMADALPAPEKLAGYRELFRQLDAAEARIHHVMQAAAYVRTLARSLAKADVERLAGDVRSMVENDELSSLAETLPALSRGVEERRIELSIGRLGMAMNELAQPQLTVRRLAAAADWSSDLKRATAFLKKASPQGLLRPALKEPGLLKRLTADGEKAQRLAGPLLVKANLLSEGTTWWLRGRFGAGAEMLGLVKSQQAVRTKEGRLLVQMPSKLETPDPFGKPAAAAAFPFYHRRHLAAWAWSGRGLHRAGWTYEKHFGANVPKVGAPEVGAPAAGAPLAVPGARVTLHSPTVESFTAVDERSGPRFRWIAENDSESLLRLVGYVEFVLALNRLEQLPQTATEAELAIIDQWVKEQDALAIYVNLSRKFPQVATTALTEWPQRPDDQFERRGLDWMIALARIELAAMRSAFANDREAFRTLRPSGYETRAYEELLIDSTRLHLWGFQADPLFDPQSLRQATASNDALPLIYERRARLAIAFLDATRQWLGPRATAAQRGELQAYGDRLAALHTSLRTQLVKSGTAPGDRRESSPVKKEGAKPPAAPAAQP